ncbi:ATP-binding cassette domain-containing protein [Endozoicomonas sp. SCSIO W0465]|nr:ATP-binding cassette domain-containing protein [Endozoicomonas sp. SCSIO W0465]
MVSVLGPSGCGKSSLLNLICGTLPSSRPKTHQAIIIRLYVRFDIS